jgi:putative ABC transport system substrate-binding protein
VKRRDFITLLGGAAAWPLAARAQEPERRRRIGVLRSPAADDLEYQGRIAAFQQALQQLGWTDARNVRIDIRWGLGWDTELIRKNVAEMVALTPDVVLATRPDHYAGDAASTPGGLPRPLLRHCRRLDFLRA